MANNILQTTELINKLNAILSENSALLEKAAASGAKFSKSLKPSDYVKALKEQEKSQKQIQASQDKIKAQNDKMFAERQKQIDKEIALENKKKNEINKAYAEREKQIAKIANAEKRAQAQRELQVKKESDLSQRLATQKAREQKQREAQVTKESNLRQRLLAQRKKEEAAAIREQQRLEKTTGLYNRVQIAINKVTKKYQDLAVRKQLGGKLSAKEEKQLISLQAKLLKYNNALKQVDAQVGRSQRNVGNYRSALVGLGGTLRTLASAFGLTSGVFLFAQGVRDAFNRIREFDKAMQNIAGIMRTTRGELVDLENEIIKVAGSSVKTSREVANLAENLVTLGKTKSEIIDLLEPVNNLAIGLETTSGEAAEFLVQTLNAFGAGSDEAAKYADTIATIRTSTTLDFQKMRDSFQYLTPISRILNKDLAYTGSVIGILADNGLKAEQAGRLLGTAQQKLASEGKSLVNALDEINEAYAQGKTELEILKIASDLFGKQAAKVGAILALNTDQIETNAQAIRDNGGALDDLVNQQLKSLDSKLLLLDSTYEKLILTIEKGDGFISKTVMGTIDLLIGAFDNLSTTVSVLNGDLKDGVGGAKIYKNIKFLIPPVFGLRDAFDSAADKTIKLDEATKKYRASVKALNEAFVEQNGSLAPLVKTQEEFNDATEDYLALLRPNEDENSKIYGTVEYYQNLIKLNNDIITQKKTIKDLDEIRQIQKLNEGYQAQIDILLNNTKGVKDNTKAKKEKDNSFKD